MKQYTKLNFITMLVLLLTISLAVPAYGETADRLRVDFCLMDDYGNLLQDYRSADFEIADGRVIYREAPKVEGYLFATANILKLETEVGIAYRVNYFYTQDDRLPGMLPDPVPLAELPMKRTKVERRRIYRSWIDQTGKELMDSREVDVDFYWETFVLPEPENLRGFQFDSVRTGQRLVGGETLPHIAYVYASAGPARIPPTLIFEHLVGTDSIRTIPREQLPDPTGTTRPDPSAQPSTGAVTGPTEQSQTPSQSELPLSPLILLLILGGIFIAATWWKQAGD